MAVWSEIFFSEASALNRIDAEYFRVENLALLEHLKRCGAEPLVRLAFVTDGIHASPDIAPEEEGIRYLSAKCVKDNGFALNNTLFITKTQNDTNRRTQLLAEDVLITSVGTIGNAAVVQPEFLPSNADRHLGIVRLYADSGVDPYYLAAFLNSRYGRFQTLREATGNVQLALFIEKIKAILIPRLSVEANVAAITRAAYEKRKQSEVIYRSAEALVSTALGFNSLDLSPRLFYEDTFSHAVAVARFDAEYYQPAKWKVLQALSDLPGKPLEEHFRPVRQLWQPTENPSSSIVRNYDLTDALTPFLDDTTPTTIAGEIRSTKKVLKAGDLVVSRLRSYLKEIAVVLPNNGAPLVGSTEFIVLRPRKTGLSAEALLVFLRSEPIQTILKWCQDGSNHPRFAEGELLRLPVPDAVYQAQGAISEKIKEATAARQESACLLEEAKQTIETAILEGG